MDSLIVIISLLFLAAGLGYGRGAGTLKSSTEVVEAITRSWAGLAGLLFLFLLIAQFLAYFNYSRIPQIAAVKLGDVIEHSNIGGIWLLLAVMGITLVIGIIVPPAIAKWALLAPIFIPLFLRLGVEPQTVLAAYRVADSPINVINPIMAYFPLIVVFAKRYDRSSGIGTVVAMMLPYFFALTIVWTVFFIVWYLLGIPLGPGAPI
jgi:aminobenzoyl-glutamate transport protein